MEISYPSLKQLSVPMMSGNLEENNYVLLAALNEKGVHLLIIIYDHFTLVKSNPVLC